MMADHTDDALELNDATDGEEPKIEEADTNDEADVSEDDEDDSDAEETLISFGDEEAAPASGERDTSLVKHLREQLREAKREAAEARKSQSVPQKIEVGERPTLEGCDYDDQRFETELDAWKDRKAKAAQSEAEAETHREEASRAWQADVQRYASDRATLGFADVEEVEAEVSTILDQTQQAVIVKVADSPAKVFYALGKHPARLTELSKISDPLKLAAAVVKLEGTLKVTKRRKAPDPEQVVKGAGSTAVGKDKTLGRLESEANRSGDRTKLIAYRKKLNAQGK